MNDSSVLPSRRSVPSFLTTIPTARLTLWLSILVAALVLVPLVMQVWLISKYGVNVPIRDEWAFIPFIRKVIDGGDWWNEIFAQVDQNRFAWVRLVMVANIYLTGWNVVAEMYLTVISSAFALLGLWLIYRRTGNTSLWAFLPIPFLFINFIGWENYLFGHQIGFVLLILGIIWTAYTLNRQTPLAFLAAIALAFFTMYGATSGLMIWVMGLLQLLGQRAGRKWLAAWLIASALGYFCYFYGFQAGRSGGELTESLQMPLKLAQFFLTITGAPLGTASPLVAPIAGAIVLILLAACIIWSIRAHRFPPANEWGAIGLIIFGLLIGGLITLGRAHVGISQALHPSYTSILVLGILGLYIWSAARLSHSQNSRVLAWGIVPLLLIIALINDYAGLNGAANWSRTYGRTNSYLLQTQNIKDKVVLDSLTTQNWITSKIKKDLSYLHTQKLSMFREPLDWWLVVPKQKPLQNLAIVSDATLSQTFTCPIETLRDMGVRLKNPSRDNPSQISLRLLDASNRVLASRTLNANQILGEPWVFLTLDEPLRACNGQSLRFELTSTQTAPKNALTARTYPPLYQGQMSQGATVLPHSSLGIELNARYYDIHSGL